MELCSDMQDQQWLYLPHENRKIGTINHIHAYACLHGNKTTIAMGVIVPIAEETMKLVIMA